MDFELCLLSDYVIDLNQNKIIKDRYGEVILAHGSDTLTVLIEDNKVIMSINLLTMEGTVYKKGYFYRYDKKDNLMYMITTDAL